ncbi:hypothetical protein K435DRAFT_810078 [Dendrothele bispora CBS 962.96]|uniref:Uncharacterized protein n=1 Tax=Dendrothele bispora (strain CBS 962.96) TaxID=1314807 RepID=A0A4S8KW62_DENBC|nr:hypothetical protein K435DRAFT_810078 [Dendrothele bispora CBS 962.96]
MSKLYFFDMYIFCLSCIVQSPEAISNPFLGIAVREPNTKVFFIIKPSDWIASSKQTKIFKEDLRGHRDSPTHHQNLKTDIQDDRYYIWYKSVLLVLTLSFYPFLDKNIIPSTNDSLIVVHILVHSFQILIVPTLTKCDQVWSGMFGGSGSDAGLGIDGSVALGGAFKV